MKKLIVSLFVLSLFAITTLSAQRSGIPANGYAVKKGNAYVAKGVKISKADERALLKIGKQVARDNNSYGKISPNNVRYLSAKLNNSKANREWWAIKNKDKWAFGGDIKMTAKMQGQIDAIMLKYTKRGSTVRPNTSVSAVKASRAIKRN